ncbi:MAG: hypothetical protein GY765_32175 [bacterium]|nr:hypothetical protein [bacterium]
MRTINITNEKKRDAIVNLESNTPPRKVFFVLQDGAPQNNIKVLRATLDTDIDALLKKYESPENLGEALVKEDPEIDLDKIGILLKGTRRLYLKQDKSVSFKVKMMESIKGPDGAEKECRPYNPRLSNISIEGAPLVWTGKLVPKAKAIKMFVFARIYQIRHNSGLSFDFLFDMAKELHEKKSLLLLGAGKAGKEPLIFMEGGSPYRGFLEGRIEGETYCLLLHLTNLELKELGK